VEAQPGGYGPQVPQALDARLSDWEGREGKATRRDVCSLRVTLPSGDAMVRRFLPTEACSVLRDVVLVVLEEVEMLDQVRERGFRVASRASRQMLRLGNTTTHGLVESDGTARSAEPNGDRDGDEDEGQDLGRTMKEVGMWPNDSLQVSFPQGKARTRTGEGDGGADPGAEP